MTEPHAVSEAVRFSPDAKTLAYIGENQELCVQDLATGATKNVPTRFTRWLDQARDRNRLLLSGEVTQVWDRDSHRLIWTLPAPAVVKETGGKGRIGALSPSGDKAAVSGVERGCVVVYDVGAGTIHTKLEGAMDSARWITFDGRFVGAIETDSHGICLWEIDSGMQILSEVFNLQKEAYWSLRFDPRGKYVAAGSWTGFLYIVRIADGEFTLEEPAHEGSLQDLSFSRDGKYLATCGDDGFLRIWTLEE